MQRKGRGVEMESPLNEQKQYIAIQNCNLANKSLGGTGLLFALLEVGEEGQDIEKVFSTRGCS